MATVITAEMVKQLREQTGVGIMECKKALGEAEGDLNKANELLRKSGKAKMDRKSSRLACEGRVILGCSEHGGILIEANCETDFVSNNEEFVKFCNDLGKAALLNEADTLEKIEILKVNGVSVADWKELLVGKIGENIQIRRVIGLWGTNFVFGYLHGNGRIGVLVELDKNNPTLGKDLAMHIAASNPTAISSQDLPQEMLIKEKEIYMAQMHDSTKPLAIQQKIVEGKLNKYIDEITLLGQAFVKDPNVKISELLKQNQARVLRMARYELGGGVSKEKTDFAAEVEAQINAKG